MSLIPVGTLLLFLSIGVNGRGVHSIREVGSFGVDSVICRCSSVEVFFQLVDELLGFLCVANTAGVDALTALFL